MPASPIPFDPFRGAATAAREALGMPGLVLLASYVGFGSLVRQSGLDLPQGLASTATAWALPGQVAMVELSAVGASALSIAIAVALTNARLTPMVVTILPLFQDTGMPRRVTYAVAHFVAVTAWATALRQLPGLPPEDRVGWFVGFALTLWVLSMAGTAAGYFLAGAVPAPVTLGLVFLNPLYFMLILIVDLRQRARTMAMIMGALLGPMLHLVTPTYGLLLTGVLAGAMAFAGDRLLTRRESAGG